MPGRLLQLGAAEPARCCGGAAPHENRAQRDRVGV